MDRIAQAGDRKPDDMRRQNEVARALATVNEGERAVPYAERTVELAEKTGKPRNIATALTTSALAYQAAGRFDEAYRRAARAIETDPGNREALAVYHSLKGRASGASAPPGGGAAGGAAAAPAARAASAAPAAPEAGATPRPALALTSPERLKVDGYLSAARRAAGMGDLAAARRELDKAAALAPDDAEVLLADAGVRRAGGDMAGALASLDRLLAGTPGHAAARLQRAETRAALGAKEAEVLEDYLQAGGRQEDFSAFYAKTLAAIGASAGGKAATVDASGKSAQASSFGRLKERSQDELSGLLFGGLAAVLVAVAVLVALRRTRKAYHLDP